MTYHKVIFCLLFLLTAAFTNAQDKLSPERVKELTELHQSIRGTFQIQTNGTRNMRSMHLTLVERIEKVRSDTEITFINFNDESRVVILPRKTIEAADFKPIPSNAIIYDDDPKG